MISVAVCVSLMVAACSAQVPTFGKCPAVDVVQDLNVTRYLGQWYEIQKFFFFIEGSEKCITADYSLKSDGHIRVLNTGIAKDGSKDVATGDAEAMDPNVPAKLSVTFNGSPRVPYWIVDTDYDTYSLVWSCTDIGGLLQADFAWILSRNNTLDNAIIEKLQNKLATFNINTKSFRQTDQSNCDY
ncbi:apolipoprotein D-like [Mya arenaria]|uniref:apolipoprotein D-like n=1 Tax=Mya arenaria TaxID=6604 RepID=UPI0022E0238E|nr:apolipoprotein D-like [Mya arenaria]